MTLIKNKWLLLVVVAVMSATTTRAQVLSDILSKIKNAAGAVQSSTTTSSVIDNLIGSSKVSFKQISGTWNYTSPAIAFETEDLVSKVGGATASAKIESTLSAQLAKAGVVPGKFSITFDTDSTFTTLIKGKKAVGCYELSGPNIIFYKNRASKVRITANAKVGTTLQVTFKTDKLLQFAQHFGQIAGSQLTSLQTLNNLIGKYKGLQVGMRFKR